MIADTVFIPFKLLFSQCSLALSLWHLQSCGAVKGGQLTKPKKHSKNNLKVYTVNYMQVFI